MRDYYRLSPLPPLEGGVTNDLWKKALRPAANASDDLRRNTVRPAAGTPPGVTAAGCVTTGFTAAGRGAAPDETPRTVPSPFSAADEVLRDLDRTATQAGSPNACTASATRCGVQEAAAAPPTPAVTSVKRQFRIA